MGVGNLEKGGGMKYQGVDLHKRYATISVRDEAGAEVKFMRARAGMSGYVGALGAICSRNCGVLTRPGKTKGRATVR